MVGFGRRLGDPDLLANGGLSDLQFCRCTSATQTPSCPLKSEKGIQGSIVRMLEVQIFLGHRAIFHRLSLRRRDAILGIHSGRWLVDYTKAVHSDGICRSCLFHDLAMWVGFAASGTFHQDS